jgi:hypothetical protein
MISQPPEFPEFDDSLMKRITIWLPDSVISPRLQLLQQVLNSWRIHDLRDAFCRPDPELVTEHVKAWKKINAHTQDLLGALDVLDQKEGTLTLLQQLSIADTACEFGTETDQLTEALNEHQRFLKLIYLATSDLLSRFSDGRRLKRNTSAYLVIQDIAAIFEWVTGDKAVRRVDRGTDRFGVFAGEIWHVIFGSKAGLESALKNWAAFRARYEEESPLIENINMRHPEWGVFDV